ncbi:MAG: hypothetical protein J6Q41_08430, partial [Firmicutes bacterium]|nr:hypothetical protein [Bacillota bacterium]
MKRYFAKLPRLLMVVAVITLLMFVTAVPAFADNTDEILNFTITVDVNDDASLDMTYHIDWKVLDDSIGELEWINLGVPNSHHENIKAISSNIDDINDEGDMLEIYLDRGYREGEIVSFEFSMTQDHMYQIDKYTEGETVYSFTPAWFDDIDVDNLVIRWNAENAIAWQPDCLTDTGYLTFKESYPYQSTREVTYPND